MSYWIKEDESERGGERVRDKSSIRPRREESLLSLSLSLFPTKRESSETDGAGVGKSVCAMRDGVTDTHNHTKIISIGDGAWVSVL